MKQDKNIIKAKQSNNKDESSEKLKYYINKINKSK